MTEFLNDAMMDISKRVAKLEMCRIDSVDVEGETSNTLITTAKGDYTLVISFCANVCLLRALTSNMKRGEAFSDAEVETYAKEYFNILCGHIVTSLNLKTHQSARFGVPELVKDYDLSSLGKIYSQCSREELFYDSGGFGPVRLQSLLYKQNNAA